MAILDAIKQQWGERVTTVFVRQGHYANDEATLAKHPPADLNLGLDRRADRHHRGRPDRRGAQSALISSLDGSGSGTGSGSGPARARPAVAALQLPAELVGDRPDDDRDDEDGDAEDPDHHVDRQAEGDGEHVVGAAPSSTR